MNRLRRTLLRVGRWIAAFCTFFITVAVLWIFYAVIHERYRYVQLPNGTRLAVTEWFTLDGGVVLKNSKGEIVVQPDIGGVVWNEQYVKGWRAAPDKGDIVFIYKVGDATGIDSTKATADEYKALIKQSGLKDEGDFLNFPSFLVLIENPDYQRAWYE